jgi:sigma-E factor negative regulatory protein RseC
MDIKNDLIQHQGVVSQIDSEVIKVTIVAQSACASCHAKGFCGAADMQEKIIEVKKQGNHDQKVGDFVTIAMKRKLGNKAVLYGYFLPFLLLLITLMFALNYFNNEGLAGLTSLGILIPYYLGLYAFRNKLKETFEFHIKE